jgi:Flp pilus assembly protein TadB
MSANGPLRDMSQLRARRLRARRRRRLARMDVGFGLLVAVVAIVLAPGLAIVALAALIGLVACIVSVVLERRGSRRHVLRSEQRAAPQRRGPARARR